MCGLDENTGEITLSDTFSIRGSMPWKQLQKGLEIHTGKHCFVDHQRKPSVILSHMFAMEQLQAAGICSLQNGELRVITFHVTGGAADEQRKALFRWIGAPDPCPEMMPNVCLRYPFGTAWIATDPRSGDMSLRITYAVKE